MRRTLPIIAILALISCATGSSQQRMPPTRGGGGAPGADAAAESRPTRASDSGQQSSELERGIVAEINQLRKNPRAYARSLRRLRRHYSGRLLELPGKIPIATVEGVAAVDEAIRALEKTSPRRAVKHRDGLARAARDHALDIGESGAVAHSGRDGSQPHERIQRYGEFEGLSAENIDFGFRDADLVIAHLLIDDGIKNRGHRRNLLAPEFANIGVACAPHARFEIVCVMDFAESYR